MKRELIGGRCHGKATQNEAVLFVAKSPKRINLRRPLRWQITCDERDHRQQHRRSGVGQRIGRRHPEELANNKATEREGCD